MRCRSHLKAFLILQTFVALITVCHTQQTYVEQSTVDLFGNKNPIFNYMPNPGHVDVERLKHYHENSDLREEEGILYVSLNLFLSCTF